MPLLYLRVIDSFVGGRGAGQVALLSAVPIGSAGGTTEMNSSSLHRFLAEAVWYPTALLPIPALSWTLIDDASALVTLTQGAISVSLEFRFNQCDEVESVGGDHLMVGSNRLPEKACFKNYARRDGVLIPNQSEVGWYTDGEWCSVWPGLVVSIKLEFE